MDFTDMTKDELEAYGRTVGIELDRRLTKSVLIDQLNDHIENAEIELSDELSDPVYTDAEIEEEDFPVTGEDHPLMPPEVQVVPEEPVDPMIAIMEEREARRSFHNLTEQHRQAEEKYTLAKQRRIDMEVIENESFSQLESINEALVKAEETWNSSKELL